MTLAHRIDLIKESPTLAVMAKAGKMKKDGSDVIILAAGEPDFATPEHIKIAAIKAIIDNKTKYTPAGGTPELKQAVIDKFARENGLTYAPNQVLVSAGGKHSLYNALQALISEGDEVVIPAPYWVSYPDMVLLADGIPRCIECSINTNYKITPQQLEEAITHKTKALILNSPNNPTGMVYTKDELYALAQVLRKHPKIYIITDDIYEHILFEAQPFTNIANVAPDMLNRIIIINGVSKAYSMTGWRIGFTACGNSALIKAMDTIQSQSTSNPCSIAQEAALAALTGGLACIAPMKEAFIKRRNYVVDRLNNINGVKCLQAQGAFYAFFECSTAIKNLYACGKISEPTDLALANYLLEDFLVAGVPGSAFGLENHMRLSFATSFRELESGLNRIEQAINL
ncbi:MAG: pyridoxal phosphate-dependent aminotransferase [Burkholderiales bacterium]|nr:pyridoxal phosphate-dependent aminotransferase [Burkholderiales bacterium]